MNTKSTLREQLDDCGFDWQTGLILYQGFALDEDGEVDYYTNNTNPPCLLAHDSPLLDIKFDTGYGSVQFPPMIAYDAGRVYVIGCYDGSSWLQAIEIHPEAYLQGQAAIPRIGRG